MCPELSTMALVRTGYSSRNAASFGHPAVCCSGWFGCSQLREILNHWRTFIHQSARFWISSLRSISVISSIARLYSRVARSSSVAASFSIARRLLRRTVVFASPLEIRSCSVFALSSFAAASKLDLNSSSFSAKTLRFSVSSSASTFERSWRFTSASASPTNFRKLPLTEIIVDVFMILLNGASLYLR